MYADRVEIGTKRSIRERLNGNFDDDFGRNRTASNKRQRQSEDKWMHDLYENREGPQFSKAKIGAEDLRLKLQKKSSQQAYQPRKESGLRDLREKLSGTVQSQPTVTPLPKPMPAFQNAKPAKISVPSVEETTPDTKKVPASTSRKKSQKKSDLSVDGLLKSLGLHKYLITFQAEEVDMAALRHMTEEDLRGLGIPMGPRKKILLALDLKT